MFLQAMHLPEICFPCTSQFKQMRFSQSLRTWMTKKSQTDISRQVLHSNYFMVFCCSRPFLWPPKCTSTQYRFSTLHSPPSKGYTIKDDTHQRLHNPRWYPSKDCITQDATHQRLHNQRWHPSKGYITNDNTTRCYLFLSFVRSFNKYFMSKGRKEITKYSETIRIGTNVEVLVLVRGTLK